jgi:hypothetical protein
MRRQIPHPCRRILASDLTKPLDIVGKAVKYRVYHRVRTVGFDNFTISITVMDYLVPAQIIEGAFCGCQRLYAKALKQRARAERRLRQTRGYLVINRICGFA